MLNKAAIIERSLRRVLKIYRADPDLAELIHLDALCQAFGLEVVVCQ